MSEIELNGICFVQKGLSMVLAAATVSQIRNLVYVFRKSRDDPDALQRQLVSKKITDIQKAATEKNIYFPNSIVVNLTEIERIDFDYSPNSEFVKMSFEVNDNQVDDGSLEDKEFKYGYIIDGQHRIEGLSASEHIKLPTVFILKADREIAFKTFAEINEKQDKVSKVLLDYIKWEIGDLGDESSEEAFEIVKSLYADKDSLLKDKIKLFEDEKRKWVSSPALKKSIRRIIGVGGPMQTLSRKEKLAIIKNYLQAWNNLYPEAWDERTRRDYVLTKSMGFTIMFRLFSRFFRRCRSYQNAEYSTEEFEQEIKQIKTKSIMIDETSIPLTWASNPFGKMSSGKGINLITLSILKIVPE